MKATVHEYELRDGTTGTIRIPNRANLEWDKVRAARKWPSIKDAPFLYMTFVTFKALQLEGRYDGTFEQFRDHDCIDIGEPDEDVVETDAGEPIERVPDPERPGEVMAQVEVPPTPPGAPAAS
jgi:hypothetical protein